MGKDLINPWHLSHAHKTRLQIQKAKAKKKQQQRNERSFLFPVAFAGALFETRLSTLLFLGTSQSTWRGVLFAACLIDLSSAIVETDVKLLKILLFLFFFFYLFLLLFICLCVFVLESACLLFSLVLVHWLRGFEFLWNIHPRPPSTVPRQLPRLNQLSSLWCISISSLSICPPARAKEFSKCIENPTEKPDIFHLESDPLRSKCIIH